MFKNFIEMMLNFHIISIKFTIQRECVKMLSEALNKTVITDN